MGTPIRLSCPPRLRARARRGAARMNWALARNWSLVMRTPLKLFAIAVLAASCQRDSSADTSIQAHYQPTSVDGRPIPTPRDTSGTETPTCIDLIKAGWYELAAVPDPGKARWQSSESDGLSCGDVTDTATLSGTRLDSGTYFIAADTLRFRLSGLLVVWRGTMRHDTLTIRRQQFGGGYICCPHEHRYVRRTR